MYFFSRKKQPAHRSTQINLFEEVNEAKHDDTTLAAESTKEKENPDNHHYTLSDEFTFNELDEVVFKLGSDCIVDDIAGAICGRISEISRCKTCFGQEFLSVKMEVIKSNGRVFFKSDKVASICYFSGKKKLSELSVRPALLEEKALLRERGKLFARFGLGSHYLANSEKMFVRGCFGTVKIPAEGRVMVDPASFLHFEPNYEALHDGMHYDHFGNRDYNMIAVSGTSDGNSSSNVPEGSLHLCWPTLCGFILKTKRWGEIAVGALSKIKFSEDAFEKLVLDPNSKVLVKSLVENVHNDMFTDIIQGKGGGCVFLLHGPPGTGKTLTAEAVSEILHRPLYCIDVGELGITPDNLEERLKKILEVAERWNAVVLIDECDIFLARRTRDDVLRNAMVGIFLRLLEYHNGVLFLTSNRAGDLDEAFQSRISVSLAYGTLDDQSRKKVWSNLLDAAGVHGIDIKDLGGWELNGRQIKTAIRLALSLAKSADEPISHKHLVQTLSYAIMGPLEKN